MSYRDLKGYGPTDPLEDSVQVYFTISVSNFSDVDTISFKYGKQSGSDDIISQKAIKVTKNGKDYLNYKGMSFEIIGGRVEIYDAIGKNQRMNGAYITIKGKDKNGKSISEFKKQMQ